MQRLSGGVKHPETLVCRARLCTDSQFLISDAETASAEAGRRPRQADSCRRDSVTQRQRSGVQMEPLHSCMYLLNARFHREAKFELDVVKLWNNRFVWLIYSLIKMMHACSVCSHMRFFHSGDPNKTKVRPCDASSALTPAASRGETPHPPRTLPPPSAFPGCSTYLEETFPQTAFCF